MLEKETNSAKIVLKLAKEQNLSTGFWFGMGILKLWFWGESMQYSDADVSCEASNSKNLLLLIVE